MTDLTPDRLAEIERGCEGVPEKPWAFVIGNPNDDRTTPEYRAAVNWLNNQQPATILSLIAWGRANLELAERAEAEQSRLKGMVDRAIAAAMSAEAERDRLREALTPSAEPPFASSGEKKE